MSAVEIIAILTAIWAAGALMHVAVALICRVSRAPQRPGGQAYRAIRAFCSRMDGE